MFFYEPWTSSGHEGVLSFFRWVISLDRIVLNATRHEASDTNLVWRLFSVVALRRHFYWLGYHSSTSRVQNKGTTSENTSLIFNFRTFQTNLAKSIRKIMSVTLLYSNISHVTIDSIHMMIERCSTKMTRVIINRETRRDEIKRPQHQPKSITL